MTLNDAGSIKTTFTMPEENVTVTANWTPIVYTITYELDGGTNAAGNPATYTIESDVITLQTPTKADHIFMGWYTDSAHTTKVTEIPAGSTGNITLYADWYRVYTVIEGASSVYIKNSGIDLIFKANGEYVDFVGVSVDGMILDPSNFESNTGSTIINLKASYLNTLSVGSHTLSMLYANGQADTTFEVRDAESTPTTPTTPTGGEQSGTGDDVINDTVENAADKSGESAPKTGDTGTGLWTGLLMVSGLGIAVSVRKRREER